MQNMMYKKNKIIVVLLIILGFTLSVVNAKKVVRYKSKSSKYTKKKVYKKRKSSKRAYAVRSISQNELLNCRQFLNQKIFSKEYAVGIDISRYQNINFSKLDTSLSFIICKASEGTRLIDRKFAYHWNNIPKTAKKGAYHFFLPHVSGKQQAQLFLSVVPFERGNMLPVIDVEQCWAYKRASRMVRVSNLIAFIREIELVLGVKPIIYTNTHFWNSNFAMDLRSLTSEYHLWVADYRGSDEPGIPKGFSDWSMWQHSPKGRLSGIAGDVDLNVCKVDMKRLLIQ
jgi:lysozyme